MFRRIRKQPPATAPQVYRAYERPVVPDPRIDMVERLLVDYFRADAIREHSGFDPCRTNHLYMAEGVAHAIATVIEKPFLNVQYALAHGRSPLSWGPRSLSWVPEGYVDSYDLIEDEAERLDARRRDALKADGHPLYTIVYHPERLVH